MDYEFYMNRALQLALKGNGFVSPNPLVGAVVVSPDGNIIGEGWHQQFGGPHAEVNAFNSIESKNRRIIPDSTLFVTLEPCAHHGKTPPCVELIVKKKIRKVVIGNEDPFEKVAGKGISILREHNIEVITGVLNDKCYELNKKFFFAHTHKRPYLTLKWAQSKDGWLDSKTEHPYRFSTQLSNVTVHKVRSLNDVIITSARTINSDNPHFDLRNWHGMRLPIIVVIGHTTIDTGLHLSNNNRIICFSNITDLYHILSKLYNEYGVISALVEAGGTLVNSFIESGLWNEARVEVCPIELGNKGVISAPTNLPIPASIEEIDGNTILHYYNSLI